MRFKHQKSRNDLPELEITPMLNVMLVVLAFFVAVAANLAEEGPNLMVRLPQKTEALDRDDSNNGEEPEFLQVMLQTGGKLSVNDRPLEKAQLLEQLPDYLQQSADRRVYLQVAGDVPYQTVIETLTALQEVGGDRVSLVIGAGEEP
ncbi:biopolymer transporter ExbD [Synechocystis sp. PCC 7339]|uniref:ExbD/TolR family protein n=1 Tax=unclassified Synechocystis TaxID=2640012 RepID=UPI001BB028EF|nr:MULTISPECIES: biopolymer transporter ExbD [unclassified Synechocystis]QUS60919.1 biopolymer transporter ExbD [Synechocystis sp. PCC 7338]UAJ73102.1 biopolymer transporter ExbD [Synechocystis sp. PCC 7339]